MVNDAGLRCGLVNLPFTYPPEPLNGFVLSGTDAPGAHRSIAHPPEIYDELIERFGHYPLKDIYPGGRDKNDYLTLTAPAPRGAPESPAARTPRASSHPDTAMASASRPD
jgi:hypothetical protein